MKHAHLGRACPTREISLRSSSLKNGRREGVFREEAERRSGWERLGGGARRARRAVGGSYGAQEEELGPGRWKKPRPAGPALTSATTPAPGGHFRSMAPPRPSHLSLDVTPHLLHLLPWRRRSDQSRPCSEGTASSLPTTFPMSLSKQGQAWRPPVEASFQRPLTTASRSSPPRGIHRVAQFGGSLPSLASVLCIRVLELTNCRDGPLKFFAYAKRTGSYW